MHPPRVAPAAAAPRQRRFSSVHGPRLRARLAAQHRRAPFRPDDPRDAARRVLAVAHDLGLSGYVERGGLDVGGAELDHLWAVVDDRVVDVTLPVRAVPFVARVRAYVAGDIDATQLVAAAAAYRELEWRVVGDPPVGCRYVGEPILPHRGRVGT